MRQFSELYFLIFENLGINFLQWQPTPVLLPGKFHFPSPVDHILSDLSTVTHPSWVAPHSTAHSFTELDKAVVHVTSLVSFL